MLVIALVALGFLSGVLGGMLGIGGGSVIVPFLILILGLEAHTAIGTSLAVIAGMAAVGAFAHYGMANVNLQAAGVLAAGAVVGVIIGARMAEAIPASLLVRIFGVVLLLISIRMIMGQ